MLARFRTARGPTDRSLASSATCPERSRSSSSSLAFAALVIGGGFAEISSNGAPTSLETAIVRYIILGSLLIAVTAYVIGGRMRTDEAG